MSIAGLDDTGYAVIDLETTGLNNYGNDRIVEIAVVLLDSRLEITGHYDTVVNPGRDTGPVSIHGITGDLAEHAPTFNEVAPQLVSLLSGRKLVAHNAYGFDADWLIRELAGWNAEVLLTKDMFIDTLWLSRYVIRHGAHSNRLSDLCAWHKIDLDDAHEALADAMATAKLLQCFVSQQNAMHIEDMMPHEYVPNAVFTPDEITGEETWRNRAELKALLTEVLDAALTDRAALATLPSESACDGASKAAYIRQLHAILLDGQFTGAEQHAWHAFLTEYKFSPSLMFGLNQVYLELLKISGEEMYATQLQAVQRMNEALQLMGVTPLLDCVSEDFRPDVVMLSVIVLNPGERVTFTGEPPIYGKQAWIDKLSSEGYVVGGFAAKLTKLVVAGDMTSISAKARAARDKGILIVDENALIERFGHPFS